MNMSSFRAFIWDPLLLICQMSCIQTVFYTVICGTLLVYSTMEYEPLVAHVFSLQPLRIMIFAQLLGGFSCAVILSLIVQRAKQCLDFACTLHFFHFISVSIFNIAIPTHLSWWGLQIASTVICTLLGEYLCMRAEYQEIKLGTPCKYDL